MQPPQVIYKRLASSLAKCHSDPWLTNAVGYPTTNAARYLVRLRNDCDHRVEIYPESVEKQAKTHNQ